MDERLGYLISKDEGIVLASYGSYGSGGSGGEPKCVIVEPKLVYGKRCLTYCGDDICDCECNPQGVPVDPLKDFSLTEEEKDSIVKNMEKSVTSLNKRL